MYVRCNRCQWHSGDDAVELEEIAQAVLDASLRRCRLACPRCKREHTLILGGGVTAPTTHMLKGKEARLGI